MASPSGKAAGLLRRVIWLAAIWLGGELVTGLELLPPGLGAGGAVQAAEPQIVRYDLNATEYRQLVQNEQPNGYVPVTISSYDRQGTLNYAVIMERQPAPVPWAERHQLSPEEFQDNFDALLAQGLRPISLSACQVRGDVKMSGIWQKLTGKWQARIGCTAEEFAALTAEYREFDLQPAVISGYEQAGQPKFAVLWLPSEDDTRTSLDVTSVQFNDQSRQLEKGRWAPQFIQPYTINGQTRLAAIWKQDRAGSVQSRSLASTGEFNDLVDSMRRQGYLLRSLNGYARDTQTRLSASWSKQPGPR